MTEGIKIILDYTVAWKFVYEAGFVEGKNVTSEVYVIMFIELHGKYCSIYPFTYPLSVLPAFPVFSPHFVSFFLSVRTRRNRGVQARKGNRSLAFVDHFLKCTKAQFPNEILNHKGTDGWNGDLRYPEGVEFVVFYNRVKYNSN